MCIETMRMESRVLEVPADLTLDRYHYPDETKRLTNTVKFISILAIVFFSLFSRFRPIVRSAITINSYLPKLCVGLLELL